MTGNTYRSDKRLLKDPAYNRYLLQENCQGWPETTVQNYLLASRDKSKRTKGEGPSITYESNLPEEYDKSIGLKNHSQYRPTNDNKEKSSTK